MDSEDLDYPDGGQKRPFQLNFAMPSSSTPHSGRAQQQPAPRKSHPSIFAPAARGAKQHSGSVFGQTPKQPDQPRFALSSLQSPLRDDFYPPQKENNQQKQKQPQPVFRMFPQPGASNPLATPSRHSQSRLHESHPTPRSESYAAQSRHTSVQPESIPEDESLGDVMRKLKEFNIVKAQLAEERALTRDLRAELTTAKNTNVALQQRKSVLEAETDRQATNIRSLNEDVVQLKHQLNQVTEEKDRTGGIVLDKNAEMVRLRAELAAALDTHNGCEDRITRVKDVARKGMDGISKKYDELFNSYTTLKLRFDASGDHLQRTKDDIEIFKASSERQLKMVESHLDENGRYLHKAAETRDLVAELQQDRNGAQQVIDILREKLQSMGSQLIDSKQKVADLEMQLLQESTRRSTQVGNLQDIQQRAEELADKMLKRENETYDILLESANISSSRREAEDRAMNLLTELDDKQRELVKLQKRFDDVESAKVREVEASLREMSAKLAASDHKLHKQDAQLAALQEKIQGLTDRNTSLSESSEQFRRNVSRLELEVLEARFACTAETNKLKQAQEKVTILEREVGKLKKEGVEGQTALNEERVRYNILQDRFDSQTMTLKLAKEQSGDLQERLLRSETTFATQLAVLQEQKTVLEQTLEERNTVVARTIEERITVVTNLETTVASLQIDLANAQSQTSSLEAQNAMLEDALKTKTADWTARLKEQKAAHDSAAKAANEHKTTLDKNVKALQTEVKNMQAEVKARQEEVKTYQAEMKACQAEMKACQTEVRTQQAEVTRLKVEAARQEEKTEQRVQLEVGKVEAVRRALDVARREVEEARAGASRSAAELERCETEKGAMGERAGLVDAVSARVRELEGDLERLGERERTMGVRYHAGNLTDLEKSFVQSLIQITQGMHEQDVVNSENELRSRDNIISSLQTKIHHLESTVAKCLKKDAGPGQAKSMIDLDLWMSSPSASAEHTPPPAAPLASVSAPPPKTKPAAVASTSTSKPARPTAAKQKGKKTTTKRKKDEDDDDDDISDVTDDDANGKAVDDVDYDKLPVPVPASTLGKRERERASSPERASRRAKSVGPGKGMRGGEEKKKTPEPGPATKAKPKKRR